MNEILLNPIALAASGMNLYEKVLFPLYWVFGKAMGFLMDLLNNKYFLAIVIFTVVTRLILLPLNVKQQKTVSERRSQPDEYGLRSYDFSDAVSYGYRRNYLLSASLCARNE